MAVSSSKGVEDAVLTAVDQDGHVLQELQLESGLSQTGKWDSDEGTANLGVCGCCSFVSCVIRGVIVFRHSCTSVWGARTGGGLASMAET